MASFWSGVSSKTLCSFSYWSITVKRSRVKMTLFSLCCDNSRLNWIFKTAWGIGRWGLGYRDVGKESCNQTLFHKARTHRRVKSNGAHVSLPGWFQSWKDDCLPGPLYIAVFWDWNRVRIQCDNAQITLSLIVQGNWQNEEISLQYFMPATDTKEMRLEGVAVENRT